MGFRVPLGPHFPTPLRELNAKINVVDWNIATEARPFLGKLRNLEALT